MIKTARMNGEEWRITSEEATPHGDTVYLVECIDAPRPTLVIDGAWTVLGTYNDLYESGEIL